LRVNNESTSASACAKENEKSGCVHACEGENTGKKRREREIERERERNNTDLGKGTSYHAQCLHGMKGGVKVHCL